MGTTAAEEENSTVLPTRAQRAFEWLTIAIFAALSLFVLLKVGWGVAVHGWIWTGALGFVFDTMQYLAWVREMGDHFLSGNMFSLDPLVRNYFNPGLGVSALLYRMGVPITIAYALWVPVGIVVMAWVTVVFMRRMVEPGWPQAIAIAIALLFKMPATWILEGRVPAEFVNASAYASWDAWPINWAWGFSLTVLAVALLAVGLLRYEADRRAGRMISPILAGIAFLCSWFQPWQGSELLAIIVGSEILALLLLGRDDRGDMRRRWTLVGTTVLAGTIPLAYYAILGEVDDSWRINGIQANHYVRGVSWWTGPLVFGPLLVAALFAYRWKPTNFGQIAIRVWPPIALVQLAFIDATGIGNSATHALKGVTLPLAALAVAGLAPWIRKVRPRPLAGVLVAGALMVAIVPGAWKQVEYQNNEMKWPDGRGGYFISRDDQDAIDFVANSDVPGGVIASSLINTQIPWQSDRQAWVGHETWTPRFQSRSFFMENLLNGGLEEWNPPVNTADFLAWTGARFLIDECYHAKTRAKRAWMERDGARKAGRKPDLLRPLETQIAPVTKSIHRFGCATVYELEPRPGAAVPRNVGFFRLDWIDAGRK